MSHAILATPIAPRRALEPGAHPSPDSPAYLPPPREPLVKTLGGGYFFAPGLPALRALASAYWR